jgi:hypothetical protein
MSFLSREASIGRITTRTRCLLSCSMKRRPCVASAPLTRMLMTENEWLSIWKREATFRQQVDTPMTANEWFAATEPKPLLEFLRGKVSERKSRLFGVACCRRIWHLLSDLRSRNAVEVAERYADGRASSAELATTREEAKDAYRDGSDAIYRLRTDIERPHSLAPHGAAMHVADVSDWAINNVSWATAYSVFNNISPYTQADVDAIVIPEKAAQLPLLRCIVGNPFHLAPRIDAAWLAWNAGIVAKLAQTAYDDRILPVGHLKQDRLGVLADALEDAGCNDALILSHLRGPGHHVRGCHVLDRLLGKE